MQFMGLLPETAINGLAKKNSACFLLRKSEAGFLASFHRRNTIAFAKVNNA
jgi:hypothetical protein